MKYITFILVIIACLSFMAIADHIKIKKLEKFFKKEMKKVEEFERKIEECNKNYNNQVIEAKKSYTTKIFDAANYLIQLYYQTGEKYYCNIAKLERLLCIANFIAIKNDLPLFNDCMTIRNFGTGVPILYTNFLGDICGIKGSRFSNDLEIYECRKPIPINELDPTRRIPPIYEIHNNELTKLDKQLLKDVFLRFGAYSTKDTAFYIDDFKNEIAGTEYSNRNELIVDTNKIKRFFTDNNKLEEYKDNEVVQFVFNYKY